MTSTWKTYLIAGLAACCTTAYTAPFVEFPDGRRQTGLDIRVKLNGDVILTTDRGDITYTKGQYTRAVADKPPEWDKAVQGAESNPKAAIPVFEKIIKDYANLEWDLLAMGQLAKAQVASGDVSGGISTFDNLFRKSETAEKGDVRWDYYAALVEAKQYNKLELALKKEISDGSRSDAARAQIIRGDILMSQGDTEGAAMDYLKTVLLYKKQRDVQAEALFKAGEALEKLKHPKAADQFKEVVQNYPQSPWAGKARGKL